jgi:hypothetical protein
LRSYTEDTQSGVWVNSWRMWPVGPTKKSGMSRTLNCWKLHGRTCSNCHRKRDPPAVPGTSRGRHGSDVVLRLRCVAHGAHGLCGPAAHAFGPTAFPLPSPAQSYSPCRRRWHPRGRGCTRASSCPPKRGHDEYPSAVADRLSSRRQLSTIVRYHVGTEVSEEVQVSVRQGYQSLFTAIVP